MRVLSKSIVLLGLFVGCATCPPMPDPGPEHPASPLAYESPPPAGSKALLAQPVPATLSRPASPEPESRPAPAEKPEVPPMPHHHGHDGEQAGDGR